MVAKFDPGANLPAALQQRLDQWQKDPPNRQFKAYGPLNAYLQGHKFPSSHYLIKPQKLLRKKAGYDDDDDDPEYLPNEVGEEDNQETEEGPEQEQENDNNDEEEDDQETEEGPDQEQKNDNNDEEEDEGSIRRNDEEDDSDGDISVGSVDSNGNKISNKHPTYPDFTVERFWGADVDDKPEDVICIIVEVASLTQLNHAVHRAKSTTAKKEARKVFRQSVLIQLTTYLKRAVKDHRILGIALLGREVALLEISPGHNVVRVLHNKRWISMFNAQFVNALNQSRAEMDDLEVAL